MIEQGAQPEAFPIFGAMWGWSKIPSKQAFAAARHKLSDETMQQVFMHLWNAIDSWKPPRVHRWRCRASSLSTQRV